MRDVLGVKLMHSKNECKPRIIDYFGVTLTCITEYGNIFVKQFEERLCHKSIMQKILCRFRLFEQM